MEQGCLVNKDMERYDKSMEMSVGIYLIAATCLAAVHCFWVGADLLPHAKTLSSKR